MSYHPETVEWLFLRILRRNALPSWESPIDYRLTSTPQPDADGAPKPLSSALTSIRFSHHALNDTPVPKSQAGTGSSFIFTTGVFSNIRRATAISGSLSTVSSKVENVSWASTERGSLTHGGK
jgi:hypothetical protein